MINPLSFDIINLTQDIKDILMKSFLFDVLYYVMPVAAIVAIYYKISPKFYKKEMGVSKINPFFLLMMIIISAAVFVLNALIWYTALFFIIRG